MNDTESWLMESDPSIRWQTMRDLLDEPADTWGAERRGVGTSGWGKRLLDLQCDDGRWTNERGPNGYRGLYTPKWTSTTYTLLLLRRLGLEPRHPGALRGCQALIDGAQWLDDGSVAPWSSKRADTCVCAMILGIFEWFDVEATDRRTGLTQWLLEQQKTDGGFNCVAASDVGSVHTTLSSLEGLWLRQQNVADRRIHEALEAGREYLLKRHLFRSRRTGEVISAPFTRFSFPPRWKYDVLRALEHFRTAEAPADERLAEAIELVRKKRDREGKWPLQNRHSGETHFEMERAGKPSRWNTLRALRVLRWWERRGGG